MATDWFRRRGYRHFDRQTCEAFTRKAMRPDFVAQHGFSPLIHYDKSEKRYRHCKRAGRRVIKVKDRPIKYASHRDACILSFYSHQLVEKLDAIYEERELSDNVIAYRKTGSANYDFAAEAFAFAKRESPVVILAFDVTSFFDTLDHALLKRRLKQVLGVNELPPDWYAVFRNVSRFHFVRMEELRNHPAFSEMVKNKRSREPIATVAELKGAGITFHPNPTPGKGIPQGTPISAALSNLYMLDFDAAAKALLDRVGGLYRRYSDDILVICKPEDALAVENGIVDLMRSEKLALSPDKTERTMFDAGSAARPQGRAAQYLGFMLDRDGAAIRPSSLSRQWRKMRRAIKRTRNAAQMAIAEGKANTVYTKRLRRRFTGLPVRNFSSYARRSAAAFGDDQKIMRQLRRFEREADRQISALKAMTRNQ